MLSRYPHAAACPRSLVVETVLGSLGDLLANALQQRDSKRQRYGHPDLPAGMLNVWALTFSTPWSTGSLRAPPRNPAPTTNKNLTLSSSLID